MKKKSKKTKGAKNVKSSAAIETAAAVEVAAPIQTPAELTQAPTSPPAPIPAAKKARAKKSGTAAQPAKPTRKRVGKKTTKRYSPESKAEILEFVRDHDAANRRGGKSAAVRKYGVSALTLSNWLMASKRDGKRVKAEGQPKAPVTTKRGRTAGAGTSSIEVTLKRMLEIRGQVAALMSEFESLKARI